MEIYQYILIAIGLAIIVTAVSISFLKKDKKVEKNYDLEAIYQLLDITNIKSIEFIRNKIVINFIDVTKFNTEELHRKGALGITIVGDKVKFYFDGGNEKNSNIFHQLANYIEG